jgi:hypothetical protein
MPTEVVHWLLDEVENIPSSSLDDGHACPWSCGAIRLHASRMGRVCSQAMLAIVPCGGQIEVVQLDAYRAQMPLQLKGLRCTYPATSRVISRTKAVRLDKKPFLLEILGAGVLGVTSVFLVSKSPLFLEICGVRSISWDKRVRIGT